MYQDLRGWYANHEQTSRVKPISSKFHDKVLTVPPSKYFKAPSRVQVQCPSVLLKQELNLTETSRLVTGQRKLIWC